jgi:hypothetical protein
MPSARMATCIGVDMNFLEEALVKAKVCVDGLAFGSIPAAFHPDTKCWMPNTSKNDGRMKIYFPGVFLM